MSPQPLAAWHALVPPAFTPAEAYRLNPAIFHRRPDGFAVAYDLMDAVQDAYGAFRGAWPLVWVGIMAAGALADPDALVLNLLDGLLAVKDLGAKRARTILYLLERDGYLTAMGGQA